MLFPIYDFDALRLDAVSSRTLIHVMQPRIGGSFLSFNFHPPLPVLHVTQPKGIHSRSPRFPFLFEATVSGCVLVAVFLNEKFHSRNNKTWTHPQACVAVGSLNHADIADQAFRLLITDDLFLSSAFWTAKLHRFISPDAADQFLPLSVLPTGWNRQWRSPWQEPAPRCRTVPACGQPKSRRRSTTRACDPRPQTSVAYSLFVRYMSYTRVGVEIHSEIIDAKHNARRRIKDRKAVDGIEQRVALVHSVGN